MKVTGSENCRVEQAYHALRKRIINNDVRPTEHLQVQKIANELSIGLTPTREALIRLAAEDVVEAQPQKGFFIKPTNKNDLLTSLWITKGILCMPSWSAPMFSLPDYSSRLGTGCGCAAAGEDLYDRIALQLGGTVAQKIIKMCNAKTHAFRNKRLNNPATHKRLVHHIQKLCVLIQTADIGMAREEIAVEIDYQILELR